MLYNGMDERIQVVTTPAIGSADTRVYLYDLDHRIVGEYGATGTADIKAEYIWLMPEVGATGPTGGDDGLGGYMPLATAAGQAGRLNWLHTHHHGAPILTTNATGTVVPYPAHAVLGFPGQFANSQQLAGAQHYYNRYRDYDVNTGRYIQADPIGLAGDDNPYLYASANPLKYGDPLGLNPLALRNAVVAGEALGGGLTIWCRANLALCMRTIAPVAIGVAKTCDDMVEILLNKAHPPGSKKGAHPPRFGPDTKGTPDGPDDDEGYEANPHNSRGDFDRIGGQGRSNDITYKNRLDGSIWQRDRAAVRGAGGSDRAHGGSAWKRWDSQRSFNRGDRPTTVRDNGTIR
jgi:RHS repeat-associated protein